MIRLCRIAAFVGAFALVLVSLASAQSVLHRPLGVNNYQPSAVAAAADGSFYVSDEITQSIQRFDATGQLLSTFNSPSKGTTYDVTGMAVDSAGNLHVGWSAVGPEGAAIRGTSGLAKLSPSGEVLSSHSLGAYGLNDLSVGANDQVYLLGTDSISTLTNGVLQTLAKPKYGTPRRQLQVGPDNRLYVQTKAISGSVVDIYETNGTLRRSFALANPLLPDAEITAFAVTPNGVYTTDSLSGTVRRFSDTGVLLGVGYGVPRAVDLAVSPSGSLLAAMP